jgi:hypothetical protein
MISYAYDEKLAYQQRYRSQRSIRQHTRQSPSTTSTSSNSSLDCEKYDEINPPPYTRVFYNTMSDKPLPPLPQSEQGKERRVRFAIEKPLPPLPALEGKSTVEAWWDDEKTETLL